MLYPHKELSREVTQWQPLSSSCSGMSCRNLLLLALANTDGKALSQPQLRAEQRPRAVFFPFRKCFTKAKTWKFPDVPHEENEDEDVKAERLRVKEILSSPRSEEVKPGSAQTPKSGGSPELLGSAATSLFPARCQQSWSAACTKSLMKGRNFCWGEK